MDTGAHLVSSRDGRSQAIRKPGGSLHEGEVALHSKPRSGIARDLQLLKYTRVSLRHDSDGTYGDDDLSRMLPMASELGLDLDDMGPDIRNQLSSLFPVQVSLSPNNACWSLQGLQSFPFTINAYHNRSTWGALQKGNGEQSTAHRLHLTVSFSRRKATGLL